jgi:hypothetical protein
MGIAHSYASSQASENMSVIIAESTCFSTARSKELLHLGHLSNSFRQLLQKIGFSPRPSIANEYAKPWLSVEEAVS